MNCTAAALPAHAELFCGLIDSDVLDPLGALTFTLRRGLPALTSTRRLAWRWRHIWLPGAFTFGGETFGH